MPSLSNQAYRNSHWNVVVHDVSLMPKSRVEAKLKVLKISN